MRTGVNNRAKCAVSHLCQTCAASVPEIRKIYASVRLAVAAAAARFFSNSNLYPLPHAEVVFCFVLFACYLNCGGKKKRETGAKRSKNSLTKTDLHFRHPRKFISRMQRARFFAVVRRRDSDPIFMGPGQFSS